MSQDFRLDNVGMVNREKKSRLNLMAKNILVSREILSHLP